MRERETDRGRERGREKEREGEGETETERQEVYLGELSRTDSPNAVPAPNVHTVTEFYKISGV